MQLFTCAHCGQLLYFENSRCEHCQHLLGFEATQLALLPLQPQAGAGTFRLHGAAPDAPSYRYCQNHDYDACNWLVSTAAASPFCPACALNRTIPNLSQPEYLLRWRRLEQAKHRLVYSLLHMRLPVVSKMADPDCGLAFDFMADDQNNGLRVMTGHSRGLITINIAEADDIEREQARKAMAELYRTLLGHFRHEVGHYYWDRLIADTRYLAGFRQHFGNEQADYGAALQRHYAQGPPPDWPQRFISAYASSHPWEDWAETWAHYLHILDTLQTAHAFGMRVAPDAAHGQLRADIAEDPFEQPDFQLIMNQWLPLTFAMNSLNRSMGQPDSYPFVIAPAVVGKLAFIHQVCRSAAVVSHT